LKEEPDKKPTQICLPAGKLEPGVGMSATEVSAPIPFSPKQEIDLQALLKRKAPVQVLATSSLWSGEQARVLPPIG